MSKFFFINFPIIKYNNFTAVNIMARAAVIQNLKQNSSNYFKYQIKSGERPDTVANDYYGDSYYDWLIMMMNNITDPYFDWYLSQEDFDAMIIDRYGSVANASKTILFWASNWYDDNSTLTISGYDALIASVKKYWAPSLLPGNRVQNYIRSKMDIIISTNIIVQTTFNTAPNTAYKVGDIVSQVSTPAANATVSWSSSTELTIQHVFGTWSPATSYQIQNQNGVQSNVAVSSVTNVIPVGEAAYYNPIDAYTNEVDKNNQKSFIILLRKEFLPVAEQMLSKSLAGAPNL